MRIVQGTYCLVETVVSEQVIVKSGEQLVILLGFRTTNKTESQVDHLILTLTMIWNKKLFQHVWRQSRESSTWRSWSGISDLYKALSSQRYVEVKKVEFLESHLCRSSEVFQYLVSVRLSQKYFIVSWSRCCCMSRCPAPGARCRCWTRWTGSELGTCLVMWLSTQTCQRKLKTPMLWWCSLEMVKQMWIKFYDMLE